MPRLLPDGPFASSRSPGLSVWQERARWPQWTWWRGVAALALVLASVVGGLVVAWVALRSYSCAVFGGYCTPGELHQAWLATAATPFALLAGPAVVCWLRRRPVWVLTPAVVLALVALSLLIAVGR